MGTAAAHAHAAIQVVSVSVGDVLLRDGAGAGRRVQSAIIPAGVRHELICPAGVHGRVSYYDPASPQGRAATALLRATGIDPGDVNCWIAATDTGTVEAPAPVGRLHPMLAQAIRQPPMPLSALAAQVGMSASRLGHLFAAELGVSYPTWRRWARLQHALATVQAGRTLTEAAHEAGFTDSAHLTRVCRAMFGITPTAALGAAAPPPAA